MSGKSAKVQRLLTGIDACGLDLRYGGYFICFDRGEFFEAHEVLEDLWLEDRRGPDGDFFKGLIQLAGAFVHLQKNRMQPAEALLVLAARNLARYPAVHHRLDVLAVLALSDRWRQQLVAGDSGENPLADENRPRLAEFIAVGFRPHVATGAVGSSR